MNKGQSLARAFTTIGLILTLGVGLSACGAGSQKWKEEVQLSDGRVIVVEREMVTEGGGDEWASNRGGFKPKEYRIRFAHPDGSGQIVEWRTTKKSPQTWPEIPLVFDMKSGQPIVFSLLAISSGCEIYSKYIYRNGVWIEEPLPEQFAQHTTNLFFGDGNDMPKFLNLEERRKRNAGPGYRPALEQAGPSRKVCG